jgi:hypothetical protein
MHNYNNSAKEQMYNCYKGQSHINQMEIVTRIPVIILKHFALPGNWNPLSSLQCNYYVGCADKKIVKSTWNTFTFRKSALFFCCLCHYYSTYNVFMLQEIFNWSVSLLLHMHKSEGLSSVLRSSYWIMHFSIQHSWYMNTKFELLCSKTETFWGLTMIPAALPVFEAFLEVIFS